MIKLILRKNIEVLADRIEHIFNTKILVYGIIEKNEPKFKDLISWGINSQSASYLAYLYIPVDDEDNIITNDYFSKAEKANNSNPSMIMDAFAIYEFASILRPVKDICNFIYSEFREGNIRKGGIIPVANEYNSDNIVSNINSIEDARYRLIYYLVDDNYATL